MTHDPLADLIEAHSLALAQQITDTIYTKHIRSYQNAVREKTTASLQWRLTLIVDYLRGGNAEEYRAYIIHLTTKRMAAGRNSADVEAVATALFDAVQMLVERQLASAEHALTRTFCLRRLSTLRILTTTTITATQMNQRTV